MATDLVGVGRLGIGYGSYDIRRRGGIVRIPFGCLTIRAEILWATFVCKARRSLSDGFVGSFLSPTDTTSISSSVIERKNRKL